MAISTEDQTKLHKVNAGLFNAAAGATYLAELESAYETGVTQLAYAEFMATNAVFTDTVLGGSTDAATIAGILSSNFGLPADDVEGSAATQAIAFFTDGLNAGRTAGDLV
ncbi:MAG: hypothetical protein OEX82_06570, partial [Nitrosomonas sp.]|nr:hypothetical protein [Nitrosomonas sp.]